jgi:hypothetical protein
MKKKIIPLLIAVVIIACQSMRKPIALTKEQAFAQVKQDPYHVRYLGLPEEFTQMRKGDTMYVSTIHDTLSIGFYKARNGILPNIYLYLVK